MLPIPILNFFPRIFQSDNKAVTLAAYIDALLLSIKSEITQLPRLYRADEVNSLYLNELGYFLSANILNVDTDQQKRKKIYNAIATTKLRGTWKYDVKIRIDIITGYDSQIITLTDSSDWILCGDGISEFGYYATLGCDGIDDKLGLNLIGAGDEIEIPGNIYIDLHPGINTPILTQDILIQIVDEIKNDVIPAYYRIYLGYLNVNGLFIKYDIYEKTSIIVSSNIPAFGSIISSDSQYIWTAISLPSPQLVKINVNYNSIAATIAMPYGVGGIDFDTNYLWVSTLSNVIYKIDINTNAIVATVAADVGDSLGQVKYAFGYIWVIGVGSRKLYKIDISTNAISTTFLAPYHPIRLTADGTNLCISCITTGPILIIDPITVSIIKSITTAGNDGYDIEIDINNNFLWATNISGYIYKIRTSDYNLVETIDLVSEGFAPYEIIMTPDNYVWVSMTGVQGLIKIDPVTNSFLSTIEATSSPNGIYYAFGSIWYSIYLENTVVKIKFIKDLEE